jgi:hypothetical protein
VTAPVTSEVVGSIPGQTHSSRDRGRLSVTAPVTSEVVGSIPGQTHFSCDIIRVDISPTRG